MFTLVMADDGPVTSRCAVLGSPIDHSLSPTLHLAAYRELGLTDWDYTAHQVEADELADFIAGCGLEWVGLSCTMPLKERLIELGRPTRRAALLRAGNTYLFGRDGDPWVENTDVTGFIRALSWHNVDAVGSALIVGAGATARSALLALSELGVRNVTVTARNVDKAHAGMRPLADELGVSLGVQGWGELDDSSVDIVVSTVPHGVDADLAARLVQQAPVVFDIIYGAGTTALDAAAESAGRIHLDGIDLLVGQGLDQVKLMTGDECAPEPLLTACRTEMKRRHGEA